MEQIKQGTSWAYRKEYREKHLEQYRKWQKDWYQRHGKKHAKESRRKIRIELINLLGGKCVRCGFDDYRALQIDHVHGNGAKDRAKYRTTYSYHKAILNKIKAGSKDYQLLCANCNWIKRFEKKEHNW